MSVNPPSRVLVVGASGYLAGFVVERLHRAGYGLRGFDRVPPPANRSLDEFVEGDITRYSDVWRAMAGQGAVVQLAALVRGRSEQPLERFVDVMVKGMWFVADAAAAAGVKRLVNLSSIVAIGPPRTVDRPLHEEEPPNPGGVDMYYQLAKWLGEEIGRAYGRARGLSVVHLRPGVIAGDGVNPGPTLPDPPRRHWFTYVDPRDVAQAVEGALRASSLRQSSYFVVADHPEAAYDIGAAKRDLAYAPQHNWLDLRCSEES
jgi:nucleoside-diphosphate-sugar epimerase